MEEAPVLLHPNMAARYREEVARLIHALNEDRSRADAISLIRSLFGHIVSTLDHDRVGSTIDVAGDLAGTLNIQADRKRPGENASDLRPIRLSAGPKPQLDVKTARSAGGGGGVRPADIP
jgi:site-specific DNA recombinase